MLVQLRSMLWSASELIFPSICLLCGLDTQMTGQRICQGCRQRILGREIPCPRCARPLPSLVSPDPQGCAACRDKGLRFQSATAIGVYGGELRELILRIKKPIHEPLCLATGELLAEQLARRTFAQPIDVIAPVPMHWLRRLSRGTNDAALLAESVGSVLNVRVRTNLVRCIRATAKQGMLLPAERLDNVRGAFAIGRFSSPRGQHVLVVDDVMTTGATLNEVARVLLKGGAAAVSVAIVARGVGFD